MNLNRSTALALRIGIIAGMVLMIVGLLLSSEDALHAGVLILIISPFLGILVSFVALIIEKDWKWVLVAAILIVITVTGIIISL